VSASVDVTIFWATQNGIKGVKAATKEALWALSNVRAYTFDARYTARFSSVLCRLLPAQLNSSTR
jgi:hypothetical protein